MRFQTLSQASEAFADGFRKQPYRPVSTLVITAESLECRSSAFVILIDLENVR